MEIADFTIEWDWVQSYQFYLVGEIVNMKLAKNAHLNDLNGVNLIKVRGGHYVMEIAANF